MIVGYIIIGTVVGLGASGISLVMGASFWAAFITYIVVGNITIVLSAIISTLTQTSPIAPFNVSDGDYLGNMTRKPAMTNYPFAQQSWRAEGLNSERSHPAYVRSSRSGK